MIIEYHDHPSVLVKIKVRMRELGVVPALLAREAGCSEQYLWRVLNGEVKYSKNKIDKMKKIMKLLGIQLVTTIKILPVDKDDLRPLKELHYSVKAEHLDKIRKVDTPFR